MPPKPDTKYLQKRGDLWLFHWRVPSDCREAFGGKAFVVKSLETHSLRDAQRRRNLMVAECQRVVDEIRSAGNDERSLFKAHIRKIQHADPADVEAAYFDTLEKEPATPEDLAFKEALKATYKGHQSDLAHCTLKEALRLYTEDKGSSVAKNTLLTAERAVSTLLEHLEKPDTALVSITRPQVKSYIKSCKVASKTISTRLSFLNQIFQVAQDHGEIDENRSSPFLRHRLPSEQVQSYQPFTKQELRSIFDATAQYRESPKDYHKYLLPRLAYATGCRLEELCSLQRAQIQEDRGVMYIAIAEGVGTYKGKTLNAGRRIPIHSSLAGEVLQWRDSSDHPLLFPVLESKRADGKMGDKYGKSFGRLKKELGISDGRHKAFHSFRVHMASNLERANVPESRAVWILGHERVLSMSYGLYSEGPSLEQLREDVASAVGYGLKEELGGDW